MKSVRFPFLDTYSTILGDALQSSNSVQLRRIVDFCLSSIPDEILNAPEARTALDIFRRQQSASTTLLEQLSTDSEFYFAKYLESAEIEDDDSAGRFGRIASLLGGLHCALRHPIITQLDVDGALYYLNDILGPNAKERLIAFCCGAGTIERHPLFFVQNGESPDH